MLTRTFIITLVYTIIGLGVALLNYYGFKKRFIGNLPALIVVALFSSFAGGVGGFLFEEQLRLIANLNNTVNIFPALLTTLIVVWFFSKISDRR